ncbi:protein of unknown function DUF349 [Fibrisoma limi BUZ 3]|uniref:DUF349 domain-containing protein n=1 Tax=Fibrisoma limi BUZ 3 TaxID=1185876 RepID=I2GEK9_9BACT|nr:DUF349 domain-containing protein [Fibrisoma limi]CCH52334.1 protein of unknown function DUF349 [Fibrisoma limi BUZ 3]
MANEEQEINQQPEPSNQATETLAIHNPDEAATQPQNTAEAGETTPAPESEVAPNAPSSAEVAGETASEAEGVQATEPAVSAPTGETATEPQNDTQAEPQPVAETPVAESPSDEAAPRATAETEPQPEAETADETTAAEETPLVVTGSESAEQPTEDTPTATSEEAEPVVSEEITAQYADLSEGDDQEDETAAQPTADYSQYSKQDFVNLLQQQLAGVSVENVTPGDFKKADQVLKEVKPLFDQMKRAEREAALQSFVQENGSDEGFEYKFDDSVQKFDDLYKQIKSLKNTYFQNLDKAKDSNFATKTELLRRLRELVENDENNAGDPKSSWNEFKQIQDEWKAAGNMNSPHNATLWATYHALVDRYYSNRNIYFELKELDRKRNATLKTEVIEKVEALAKASEETPVTRQTIDEANAMFEEYKHIGPAPKADQEVLWQRMKAALDTLYEKRRGQTNEQRKESAQLYEEKSKIYEDLVPFTSFTSNSINDWNDKTKDVMALQDRWNALKGPMPREEGKELSKKFWAALKTFFHNKGEFFKQLESKREENLRLKTDLCEQVEAILASGDESAEATQRVIDLQRQWKTIGQVPEKQKNSIFDRFKAACDAFFNKKRSKNQETEREFEGNLARKIALIERIEAAATENADLSQLNEFKKEWNSIGFVPKKDMQSTQKRYINAINALVGATGKLSAKDKERVMLQNEAEVTRGGGRDGGRDGGGGKREGDIRRRISALENDIATYNNNIEFFARSKNADKLRADIEKKIADAQKQLDDLRHQLRVAQA